MENVLQENVLCVQNDKQDFVVSATVYKARHLRKLNCDTFVMVSCNGKYKRTRIAYRTDNPYFNEVITAPCLLFTELVVRIRRSSRENNEYLIRYEVFQFFIALL